MNLNKNSPIKISQAGAGTDPSGTHKFQFSSCHSWLRDPSLRPAPSFQYNIFISVKPYLWAQWERPLELCLHRHSGSHQRADSAPRFLPPPPHLTADPWSRLRFLVGRSSGSLCLTRTAGQLLDQLPGNTGVPGCYCIQDRHSVTYNTLSLEFADTEDFSLNALFLQCSQIVL